jgi:hypothetical protein
LKKAHKKEYVRGAHILFLRGGIRLLADKGEIK